MTRCVTAGGMLFQVTADFDENDPEQMGALRELAEHIHANVPPLTPEQIAKQDAARARNRERIARITGREPA